MIPHLETACWVPGRQEIKQSDISAADTKSQIMKTDPPMLLADVFIKIGRIATRFPGNNLIFYLLRLLGVRNALLGMVRSVAKRTRRTAQLRPPA